MTSGPLLVPNLGAEEGTSAGEALRAPHVRAAARLWRFLFSDRAEVAGGDDGAFESWPEPLVPSRGEAAYDWLDEPDVCFAWLATDEAERIAREAGRALEGPHPANVLRVHDKAFALRAAEHLGLVPRLLRGTSRILTPGDLRDPARLVSTLRETVDDWPPWTGGRFTLKPRQGTSGRGRFDGTAAGLDVEKLGRALPRLAACGGAILEPWLERTSDLSVQMHVAPGCPVTLLGSLALVTHRSGVYRGHRGEVDSRGRVFSGDRDDETLRGDAAQVADAAAHAGYAGPAGIDAFHFRIPDDPEREPVLRPVVELNARFTMGTVVIGLVRRLLPRLRADLGLGPGERRAFRFDLDAKADARSSESEAVTYPLGCEGEKIQPAIRFSRGPTAE